MGRLAWSISSAGKAPMLARPGSVRGIVSISLLAPGAVPS